MQVGADPELLGGAPIPGGGGGRLPNILIIFSEKPIILKKFWSVGGSAPLDPPLQVVRGCYKQQRIQSGQEQ